MDRLTLEIASSLRQRKTLPVWLFDESLSLEARREQIIERFENVYRQLGLMDDIDTKDALKTGVIGFGKDIHVLVEEPTSDIAELTKAVKSITSDVSGAENVFAAIQQAVKTYGPVRKKMRANMMLIIVTDERGDDFGGDSFAVLEDSVKRLARDGVKVYVVGNSSPFGRQKGLVHMKWKDEEGTEHEGELEADQDQNLLCQKACNFRSGHRMLLVSSICPQATAPIHCRVCVRKPAASFSSRTTRIGSSGIR